VPTSAAPASAKVQLVVTSASSVLPAITCEMVTPSAGWCISDLCIAFGEATPINVIESRSQQV
jgi:hypothetical protein